MESKTKNRIIYFDFLRIIATIAVMLAHVTVVNWYGTDVRSFAWQVFNFGDSIARWSVLVFIMISGALFLETDMSIEVLYKKNILRIVTAFIFWSVLYATVELVQGGDLRTFCYAVIKGHFHMWFLFMIVGLYMIVPFVRKIVESRVLMEYFLVLSFVFNFIIPHAIMGLSVVGDIGDVVKSSVDKVYFHFAMAYVWYFVLGYYLSKTEISKSFRRIIYFLSILGFLFTIVGTSAISIHTNTPQGILYENFTLNVFFEVLGVFVFFKYNVGSVKLNEKVEKIVLKLSKYSFGAYLVHALIIEQLKNLFGIDTMMCNPIVSTIVITAIVACVSYAISFACNHIPVINKYIV